MPADHLAGDRLHHVTKRERVLLLRHAGMEHNLQQQVTEFVPEVLEIVARNGVGHLIGFLDGVGSDSREILFEIPRAAGHGGPQFGHDVDETGDIAGRGHRAPRAGRISPVCRIQPAQPISAFLAAKPDSTGAENALWARHERTSDRYIRAGAVFGRAGFRHLPGLGAGAIFPCRNHRLLLRPAPYCRVGLPGRPDRRHDVAAARLARQTGRGPYPRYPDALSHFRHRADT